MAILTLVLDTHLNSEVVYLYLGMMHMNFRNIAGIEASIQSSSLSREIPCTSQAGLNSSLSCSLHVTPPPFLSDYSCSYLTKTKRVPKTLKI